MSFISRILLYNSSLCRINKGAVNVIQKLSLSEVHYKHSNHPKVDIIPKEKTLNTVKRLNTNKPSVKKNFSNLLPTKLHRINLSVIVQNAENLPNGLLIATFQKLCFLYHKNKNTPYFYKELNFLSKSEVFQDFCRILEKKLPKFQPTYLSCLLDLIHFNISPKSTIMSKIFVLILDNIHYFPALDLIELYCQLQEEPFKDIPNCKLILQGCENYFENYLEEELSHYYDLKVMSHLISEKNLPLNVRKLLTEKCLSLIESEHYNLTSIPGFFLIAFEEPILSFYKTELLDKFKLILDTHKLPKIQDIFSTVYKKVVHKNDSTYNEEICKMLIDNMTYLFAETYFIKVVYNLCEIGYYDQCSIEKASDLLLTSNPNDLSPFILLRLVSIFVDSQGHEMNNPHWGKIKSQLESCDVLKSLELPDIFQWCELLTFLGCDTTSLFSHIFDTTSEVTETSGKSRSILRLHHVCKKYFPESGLGLSKKLISNCLQNSVYQNDFYVNSHVHKFFGGEDYVVENCHSSDCHFFPIVVVLGPDNKPIDLSSYKNKDGTQINSKNFRVTVNIDYIKKPPGSKVIAFLPYQSSRPFRFRNAPITSGLLQMFLKPYEGLNCNIVLLPHKYFSYEDDEKSKYLSSEINKIIESSDTAPIRNEI